MAKRDSIDKIVQSYFAAVTLQPFTYKDVLYMPHTHVISPQILRPYTCHANCGACCPVFSLDYIPIEPRPYDMPKRHVVFNGHDIVLYTDWQYDNDGKFCRNLRASDARCKIHQLHPFSCDFELIRSSIATMPDGVHRMTTRLFGRGWNMLRIDDERGARCTVHALPTSASIDDTRRRLVRLQTWAKHFKLHTSLPQILQWIDSTPETPLTITPK